MSSPRFAKIVLTLWVLAAGSASAQSGAASYGAASPQAVVAALQKAMTSNDLAASVPLIAPAGREEMAKDLIGGVLIALAMFDPDVPAIVGKPPSKTELEAQRKSYRTGLGLVRQALKPHGLDSLVGKPLTPETEPGFKAAISAALPKTDTVVLATALLAVMDRVAPMMGMPKPDPTPIFSFRTVTDYKVDGDRATAKADSGTLEFERVQGRWYIKAPAASK